MVLTLGSNVEGKVKLNTQYIYKKVYRLMQEVKL
jgi:hypothetical protein